MSDNVIDLNVYRLARDVDRRVAAQGKPSGDEWRRISPAEQAFRIASKSHCVDARTGHEVAGIPTVQLVQNAPAAGVFWVRLFEGGLYFVADSDLAWQRSKGWLLTKVRLVTPGAKHG